MHILFLTQVLPYPLDAGPKVRAYYVLRYLAQYHKVTLVSFVRATDTPDALAHLRQYCASVHTCPMPRSKVLDATHMLRSIVTNQPFLIARDSVPAMHKLIQEVMRESEQFDAVHADQLWMAPYALRAQSYASNEHRPAVVLDQHNAVYLIPKRMAEETRNPLKLALLRREAHRLAQYEVEVCRKFDQVVWVTKEDYEAVQRHVEDNSATLPVSAIIPICVDFEPARNIEDTRRARRVTFLGGLHYPPNADGVRWFAEQVFAKVLAAMPDAILTVIGKQPPDFGGFGIPSANLDVTGYVADPMPYLEETAAFIVPLHAGGGMRVKILDAWKWGVPIISTTVGAEGIHAMPGENILIADAPDDFAKAVILMLENPDRGKHLAQSGRVWVKQRYFWQTTYQQWDQIYHRATDGLPDGELAVPTVDLSSPQPV